MVLSYSIIPEILFLLLYGDQLQVFLLVQIFLFKRIFLLILYLLYRVIADITPLEDRNKYYSRLEALTSAAFILGPALAGILAGISIWFPLYE